MPYCAYCGTQVAQVSFTPCPSCGKPTNGAPRAAAKSGSNAPVVLIFVVIGGLVLLAIIGIIAAIAIPNLLTAMQRSKQKRTMADIRSLATAVEAYATDRNSYPDPEALEQELVPKYIASIPATDGWTTPLRYECWSDSGEAACDSYAIGSAGKDAVFDRDSLRAYEGAGATTNFDADIVFINGAFVQYPDAAQTGG
ncbi:MAG TPA: type II secretion system protein GspG [Thermoanaerobaculia bacterium]|nr:type II secretion system protein GspG [Thermoanaerobaculia bacterium]